MASDYEARQKQEMNYFEAKTWLLVWILAVHGRPMKSSDIRNSLSVFMRAVQQIFPSFLYHLGPGNYKIPDDILRLFIWSGFIKEEADTTFNKNHIFWVPKEKIPIVLDKKGPEIGQFIGINMDVYRQILLADTTLAEEIVAHALGPGRQLT